MTVSSSRDRVFPFRAQSRLSTWRKGESQPWRGLFFAKAQRMADRLTLHLTLHGLGATDMKNPKTLHVIVQPDSSVDYLPVAFSLFYTEKEDFNHL
jgi:hypothetical protein